MAGAPRKAGKPMSSDNIRGVLCANEVAKPLGKVLREEHRAVMSAEVAGWQDGAVRGGSTERPIHLVRFFLLNARAEGRSAAALFADLRAAFYSIWPEIAAGVLLSDEDRRDLLEAAGLTEQEVQDILDMVEEATVQREEAPVPPVWQRLLAE